MCNKKNIFILGLVIAATLGGLSYAALIGVQPRFPTLIYDGQGALTYDAVSDVLLVDSIPFAIRFSPTVPPRFVSPTAGSRTVTIGIEVDDTGTLVGGVPGDDLLVEGEVDQDGDDNVDFAGILLTGEVAQFGSLDSGGPTDQFDFRFQVTGGTLAGFYLGKDIGVILQSEGSSFTGDFAVNFSGGGKGILGPIDAICALDVTVEGCVQIPPPPLTVSDCDGKLVRMTLLYTGEGCSATSHSQDQKKKKVHCTGDPAGAEPVSILVTDKKGKKVWASETGISIGGSILVDAAHASGKHKHKKLKSTTKVTIFNAASDVIQEVLFHTSCSQPLNVGDQFGSLRITSLTSTKGGEVVYTEPSDPCDVCITELPATEGNEPQVLPVEYTYTITNNSVVYPLASVSVVDDVWGVIPGSPIASIAPGETATLTLITPVSEETTNTVTVTGLVGGFVQCQAMASATITSAEPPVRAYECTTKIKAMLLKYTGPDILDATVEVVADTFRDTPVVYTGIDLTAGTILSLPLENGFTIDASAHNQRDLGAKMSIFIDGVKEVLHTSCSTPFVRQAPAPLNEPKGDPSPNWFVMEFAEKD